MPNILVVDDEARVVALMRLVLELAGHRVSEASNGEEALKALGVEPPDPSAALPDLVILDIMMPKVDGHTVAVKLRNDPRTAKLPILIVTSLGDTSHLFQGVAVAGTFQKPFSPKELRETVSRILSA